jgi:hypothetical protein
VRINGQPVRRSEDVGTLVPEAAGSIPSRIVLDAGNGLRLEAMVRDGGRFDVAYVEAKQRYLHAPLDRDALLTIMRAFAARDPKWRAAGPWELERKPPKRPRPPPRPNHAVERRATRGERHATIAGFVVLGIPAVFVVLQIFGVKIRLPDITLPGPFNSTGAKALLFAFLLFWFFFALAAAYKLWEVRRARAWKRAHGRIVSSEIGNDVSEPPGGIRDLRRVAKISYEFKAGSRTYLGTRIDLAERPSSITNEELERRFPVGKVVSVYYDPSDPETCVLDRDLPSGAAKGCLVATLVVVPIVVIAMFLITAGPGWVLAVLPNAQPHVFLLASIGAIVTGLYSWGEHVRRGRARHWPGVEGIIVSSGIEQRTRNGAARTFVPAVLYRYTVGKETYHTSQIRLGIELGGSESYAEQLIAPYSTGTTVRVHYDPNDPQDSALEWNETVPKVAGLISAGLFAVAIWSAT